MTSYTYKVESSIEKNIKEQNILRLTQGPLLSLRQKQFLYY
jgi:hypothetical protein